MAIDDPRSEISFSQASGSASLPDTANAALIIGSTTVEEAIDVARVYGSAGAIRGVFEECPLTEICESHFATDPARHPVMCLGVEAADDGVLTLDTSGVTGGGTATASVSTTPLGDWPDIYVEVITTFTAGTAGGEVYLSLDGGLKKVRTALLTATSIEFAGKGIKIDISGTFNAGSIITGWTTPPRWDSGSFATAQAALLTNTNKFSLLCFAEPVTPDDWTIMTGLLNALEAAVPRRFAHIVAAKRRRYHETGVKTIEATFANANPDTLARAAGSFITDGFKAGMRVTIDNAANPANEGTFVRIATVAALTLTFTTNVAFTAEVSTSGVTVSGEETADDYAYNVGAEWATYHDVRITLTNAPIRAQRPADGFSPDQNLHGFLWSRLIATPIQTEPAKRRRDPSTGGGVVAPELAGRIIEGTDLVLPDVSMDAYEALALPPSRAVALQREGDGSGPYFVQARTMYELGGTDQIDRVVYARIVNEAKYTVIATLTPELFNDEDSAPGQPSQLSSKSRSRIESAVRTALQKKLSAAISNAFTDDPQGALFEITNSTDLTTGIVQCKMFFRAKFYTRGFAVTMSIVPPGA